MAVFDSASIYISSATSIADKIIRLDLIISALYDAALRAAANEDITEYTFDDGQVKILANYKGTDSVFKSIQAFEKLKEMYMSQLNGRVFRLCDSKNFGNYNTGGRR